MSALIDLREHFGLWDRCGNTRFWKQESDWLDIYVNPIDGLLIIAGEAPGSGGRGSRVLVKDAKLAEEEPLQRVFAAEPPWVKKAIRDFFMTRAYGWVAKTIKEYSQGRLTVDHEVVWFLSTYKDAGAAYRLHGSGDPLREELFMAVKKTLAALDGITRVDKVILKEELEEFLGEYGLLECA